MKVDALRNWDLVLVDCTVGEGTVHAQLLQCNQAKLDQVRGTTQQVQEPKKADGLTLLVDVPPDVTELYYDVTLPCRPLDSA